MPMRRIPGRTTRTFDGLKYVFVWSATSQREADDLVARIESATRKTVAKVAHDDDHRWHVYKRQPGREEIEVMAEQRYYSDWFDVSFELGKGMAHESILRLGHMEAINFLSQALMRRETPIPTTLRFEQETKEGATRVVLIAEVKEPQE